MIGLDQVVIGICGLTSVWLSQDARQHVAKWACLFGLAAQPAWFYTTWQAGQWAIFGLAFVYTAGWGRGVWNFWIKPRLAASPRKGNLSFEGGGRVKANVSDIVRSESFKRQAEAIRELEADSRNTGSRT